MGSGSDWVDNAKMDDPEDSKPDDWEKPEHIADPDATKPEDWDDEMEGEWKPRQIDNPEYKGAWIHPEIDNPEYNAADADGNQDRLTTQNIRELGFTQKLITLNITQLMPMVLPSTRRTVRLVSICGK